MSSTRAFALFIDPTAGGGPATTARRVIPFPHANNVRLSLVYHLVPGSTGVTGSIQFFQANGSSLGTAIPIDFTQGQFAPGIPSGAVGALVDLTFPTPSSLPAVTALVQYD